MKTYFEAIGEVIPETMIASKDGLSYLSAARAMQLAGLPNITFVDFAGKPYLPMMGGAVVAVDLALPGSEIMQRTWLPVMDQDNRCIKLDRTTVSDINNSRQRCLVKAIATVLGTGMSVFLGVGGDGKQAVKLLGLSPESDLAAAEAVLDKLPGGEPYLGWNFALTAARIVDSEFTWAVTLWDDLPYREVLGGVFIDIETNYRGKVQRLSLPMLDEAFHTIPVERANVWLWNRTVMRALSKTIAFTSGYGLRAYVDDFSATVDNAADDKAVEVSPKAEPDANNKGIKKAKGSKAAAAKQQEVVAVKVPVEKEDSRSSKSSPEPSEDGSPTVKDRFNALMDKRYKAAGILGLIVLYDALEKSDKYTEEEKPICKNLLTIRLALLPEDAVFDPLVLLSTMAQFKGMEGLLSHPKYERVCAKLIALCLRQASRHPDVLGEMPMLMASAKIVNDSNNLGEVLADFERLAKLAGVSEEIINKVKEVAIPF